MANRTNLIATYNANPTLQSRYTLQQYLDLFGLGQTTTPTPDPDPTPTPTPEEPGIPNIINQNLNQGGRGGGDGTGPQNIPERKQYFEKTYTGQTFPDGTPIMSGFEETEGPDFLTSLGNAFEGLASFAQTYSPLSMIGKAIQNRKDFKQAQTNKALEQAAIQEQIRQAEAQAAAEAAALANATTYRYNDPSQKIDPTERADRTSDAFRGGGANVPSATYTDTGREGFAYGLADGGRVYLYNRLK